MDGADGVASVVDGLLGSPPIAAGPDSVGVVAKELPRVRLEPDTHSPAGAEAGRTSVTDSDLAPACNLATNMM